MMYPYVKGHISTEPTLMVTDKRQLFNWLKCKASDYPPPEELPPVPFDSAIFRVLATTTDHLKEYFQRQRSTKQIKPRLSKLVQQLHHALTQIPVESDPTQLNLLQQTPIQLKLGLSQSIDQEVLKRVTNILTNVNLKIYEKDLKGFWDNYVKTKDLKGLLEILDDYFIDNELYHETEEEPESNPLEFVQAQDIQLLCYQWFKPN